MAAPRLVPYLHFRPRVAASARFGDDATAVGRTAIGEDSAFGDLVVLRGDGERIEIGAGCRLMARATVHISDGRLAAHIGDRATVGRYALVHACVVGDDAVLCDGAVTMDGAGIGAGAVIAAGALVPPGKTIEGGALYAGNPARPVRRLKTGELEAFRRAVRSGRGGAHLDFTLPPLSMAPFRGVPTRGAGPFHSLLGATPEAAPSAFVAANAALRGRVRLGESVSVWYATAVCGDRAGVVVGARSNIQDNSILFAGSGGIDIGEDVTVGHNVRMGACRVGDRALIGMGAEVADGVTVEEDAVVGARAFVEPGTAVRAGHIWAGRPARAFRAVSEEERRFFARGCAVYVDYAARYLAAGA